MAEFNPSNTIDSQLANLPPEYAAQIAKLLRQQQMAQAGAQMGMQGISQPTQFTPGPYAHPVVQNPLVKALQAFQVYQGQKGISDADQGIAGVKQKAAGDLQRATQEMLGMSDPSAQVAYGRSSQWGQLQKLAETLAKSRQEQGFKAADVLKDRDPKAALASVLGGLPGQDYTPPQLRQPEVTFIDDPNNPGKKIPQTVNYDIHGQGKAHLGAQGNTTNVDARQGIDAGKAALEEVRPTMKTWQEKAAAAKEAIQANSLALEALNRGAKAGGLEGFKQSMRGVLQGFGIDSDKFTETSQLQMALGNAILAHARKLAPVTAEDVKRLEVILGSVNTDPRALEKMLVEYNGMATKTLQDANRYFSATAEAMPEGLPRNITKNSGIGLEMIPPPGNTLQGLRAIQSLQRQGGDITQFAIGGEPIPPDAKFELGSPPARPATTPSAPKKPVSQMTPEEKAAEISRLEKLLLGK